VAGRVALIVRGAKRAAPVLAEVYRRWEKLTPEEKERYRKRVRESGERARQTGRRGVERLRRGRRP
jgi:hypothetical protein